MADPRDYKLDIASLADRDATQSNATGASRPFLSVKFACCNVYCRIYRNNDGSRYEGRCPRCGQPVRFVVGQGGTDSRFFVVE
jgi:hypothetical protein